MTVDEMLIWAMPSPEECRTAAGNLRDDHPDLTAAQVARRAVKNARFWATATGAATGAVANPLAMVPAAMVEVAAVLRIEAKMAGVIGALLDPKSTENYDVFRADVLSVVFPGVAAQALQQLGVRAGQQTSKTLIRNFLDKGLLGLLLRLAAKYLGIRISKRAIISKTVPIVGGCIGASWNWLEVQAIGRRAISYYQGRAQAGD
jgi:hypothetical protein